MDCIFLLIFFIPFFLWNLYEQDLFHRAEGPLKRGVRVWRAEPLSGEARAFLESQRETKRNGMENTLFASRDMRHLLGRTLSVGARSIDAVYGLM